KKETLTHKLLTDQPLPVGSKYESLNEIFIDNLCRSSSILINPSELLMDFSRKSTKLDKCK
ncbi:hypothetical protein GJ496_000460, partial [Pomphorhynchus laevis]